MLCLMLVVVLLHASQMRSKDSVHGVCVVTGSSSKRSSSVLHVQLTCGRCSWLN
jgi:hypothetical protein